MERINPLCELESKRRSPVEMGLPDDIDSGRHFAEGGAGN